VLVKPALSVLLWLLMHQNTLRHFQGVPPLPMPAGGHSHNQGGMSEVKNSYVRMVYTGHCTLSCSLYSCLLALPSVCCVCVKLILRFVHRHYHHHHHLCIIIIIIIGSRSSSSTYTLWVKKHQTRTSCNLTSLQTVLAQRQYYFLCNKVESSF